MLTMRTIMLALVLMLGVTLAGCATTGSTAQEEFMAKSAVSIATGRFIRMADDPAERAARVDRTVSGVLLTLEGTERPVVEVTLDELEQSMRDQIPWDRLMPEEVIVLDGLILMIREELELRTDGVDTGVDIDIGMDEEMLVRVTDVFGWVSDTAKLYRGGV